MNLESKGRNPFTPGLPVAPELFFGRKNELRTLVRDLDQVGLGSTRAIFLMGEYGIGKSSMAQAAARLAQERDLVDLYIRLAAFSDLDELYAGIFEQALRKSHRAKGVREHMESAIQKYIKEVTIFGAVKFNVEAIQEDRPKSIQGVVELLNGLADRMGAKGVYLVFDEINGFADKPAFAHFLKGLVESSQPEAPLALVVCGTEGRHGQLVAHHEPVARLFHVHRLTALTDEDVRSFFISAFEQEGLTLPPAGLDRLVYYAQGYPKFMQELGHEVYYQLERGTDEPTQLAAIEEGINLAIANIGEKYVQRQILDAIRSDKYKLILKAIADQTEPHKSFSAKDLEPHLDGETRKGLNNFIQRFKQLGAIRPGAVRSTYQFSTYLEELYLRQMAKEGSV